MSVCYSMMCHKCKKAVWIGQTTRCFYSGEPHTMEALGEFLFDHKNHPLTFEPPEWRDDMGEWEEIDTNKYKQQKPPITATPA